MKILSIETSCDETSCALVENGRKVLSNVVASQIEEHRLYGGVVPEIASRRHCESIIAVCEEALKKASLDLTEVDAIAVTYAPGLIGALLVGVNFAKGLALSLDKPLIPVHHIRSHIAANYIMFPELEPPFISLVVSGGHTSIIEVKGYADFKIIGSTLDDAAGEAFDKAARAMGFPYPGGIYIEREAVKRASGDFTKYKLPRPKTQNEFDFSFSGLKTAIINLIHNSQRQKNELIDKSELCASFQEAVCEILTEKTIKAANKYNYKKIALAGGVAANSKLRETLGLCCLNNSIELFIPDKSLCGDNAAMVGCQAFYEYLNGNVVDSSLNAYASMAVDS